MNVAEEGLPHDELGDLVRHRNIRIKTHFANVHLLLQEQQKRAELAGELAQMSYSIMHDMRAPLRAITSFGELLQAEAGAHLNLKSRDYLAKIKLAATRMDCLIRDVLNYAQIVPGKLPLLPVNAADLLNGIVETYPNLQPFRANIHLSSDSAMVLANEAALTQCFSNLLDNAVRFSRPGVPVKVQVRFETKNDCIRVWIEDNGLGIPTASKDRIFENSVQENCSPRLWGMGLAIVRKAAERMGGRVGVISEPNQGSSFWIELSSVKSSN